MTSSCSLGGKETSIEIDDEARCADFIRLNEIWISEHFALEEADRRLARDPFRIVRDGGRILSLLTNGRVIGVCALFRESAQRYELARMAVDPSERGKGHGSRLLKAAIDLARADGASTLFLLSNTALESAITLYRRHGFDTRTVWGFNFSVIGQPRQVGVGFNITF